MRLTFKEIKDEISKIVPRDIEYNVDLESGDIAIFTKDFEPFTSNDGLAGKISKKIKRRIVMRPEPDMVMDKDDASLQSSKTLFLSRRTFLNCSLILAFGKSLFNVRILPMR